MICSLVTVVQRIVAPSSSIVDGDHAFLKELQSTLTVSEQHGYPLHVHRIAKKPLVMFPLNRENKAIFEFECQVLYFKPHCGEVLFGSIAGFDEHGNMLVFYGFEEGYVHSSQFPANFTFNRSEVALAGPDRSLWKVGDLLKLKVVEERKTLGVKPRLRFTLKGASLGKI